MNAIDNATSQTNQSLSTIDAALAASTKRQAAKKNGSAPATGEAPAATAPKRTIKTPEQRIDEAKKREDERAQRKIDRQAKRDAAKAAKPAAAPAHMKKVEKAAAALPALSDEARSFFEEVKASLSTNDQIALSAHIQLNCRASATVESSGRKLTVGQSVEITTTDVPAYAKHIGQKGTVAKANRVRCYISVPGFDKLVYLHLSDVTPCEAPAAAEPAPIAEPAPEASAA